MFDDEICSNGGRGYIEIVVLYACVVGLAFYSLASRGVI